MGLWEGLTRDDIVAGWPGDVGALARHQRRLRAARRRVPHRGRRPGRGGGRRTGRHRRRAGHCWCAHGGLVVGLTGSLLDLPHAAWGTLIGIGNCHWVVLHRTKSGWRLQTYNGGLGGIVMPGGEDQVAGT